MGKEGNKKGRGGNPGKGKQINKWGNKGKK